MKYRTLVRPKSYRFRIQWNIYTGAEYKNTLYKVKLQYYYRYSLIRISLSWLLGDSYYVYPYIPPLSYEYKGTTISYKYAWKENANNFMTPMEFSKVEL